MNSVVLVLIYAYINQMAISVIIRLWSSENWKPFCGIKVCFDSVKFT